jgi:ribonuclease D
MTPATLPGEGSGEQRPSAQDRSAPPEESVAPLLTLRGGLPPVITTQAELDETVQALAAGSGSIAVDAERASGYRYSQRAYLIQLRREGAGTFLIDPLPFGDVPNDSLAPLSAAVAHSEWILHAASQDLPCLAELGMRPNRLFDTELAGRLLNYPRVGLAVMVEGLLGYSMRKEHSAVDWSRRPMPASWLRYAALDVEMLIELRNRLAEQLLTTGKSDWAEQEFAAWAQMGPPAPRSEPWRRTSGIHRVRGRRGLAIVRELWTARDDIARASDTAPGKILRDVAIVEAAQAAPASRRALLLVPGFGGRSRRHEREFADAVARARALPEADLPAVSAAHTGPPPPRVWASRFPAAAARIAACREQVSALAAEYDLPQENLLEPDAVRRLAWAPPEEITPETVRAALQSFGARPWQVELTAPGIAAALAGPA